MSAPLPSAATASPAILAALPWPVAVLDSQGVVRAANSAWEQAEGVAPGSNYLEICDPECSALLADVAAGRLPRALIRGREVLVATPLGSPASGIVLSGGAGDWRTLHHGFDQVLQAQKLETVGRLTGGVAHDFSNLLTLISGYCEILLGRLPSGDPLRPELEEIRTAANRGSSLTGQLLDYTRRRQRQDEPAALDAVVSAMERMLRRMIGEHIEVSTSFGAAGVFVPAGAVQVEQLLMNLALNARDAMPGGGRLRIRTAVVDPPEDASDPGPHALLEVADTGSGIPRDTLAHIFEPFFTTKGDRQGTGLGLTTVSAIVRQARGCISVETSEGQGSRFSVYLPLVRRTSPLPPELPGRVPAAAGSETILVAEDEPGVRRLLAFVLRRHGYTVLEAEDGEAAVAACRDHPGPVHLVITDMIMPRMGGAELVDRLRASCPDIQVICMSGYNDELLRLRPRPGVVFLQKPLKPEALAASVRELLDGARMQKAAAPTPGLG